MSRNEKRLEKQELAQQPTHRDYFKFHSTFFSIFSHHKESLDCEEKKFKYETGKTFFILGRH